MPDCSVDAIVTDPPYGLSFMGKKWDYDVPSVDVWAECLRALKPGGHLLAFAGTRTQHRMAVRIEDAGFEIRDMIAWVYGSGFPKSLNLKDEWQGWGTALKPALEPITVARKPLVGTVAENVLQHGTGAINVDGGRVEGGRWPANFIHDGSEEVVGLFPQSNGGAFPKKSNIPTGKHYDGGWGAVDNKERTEMGSGSAARFFYCAKASKADRGENHHPTVKPTDLMRYLCRLVTPPNGIVLDPYNGSGSTGCAAVLEGFQYIGIEREAEYIAISEKRIQNALERKNQVPPKLF
jgi:site-specific DNA-methyltransferase (adenine-specific)